MNVHEHQPLLRFERWVSRRLDLQDLGKKLLIVGIDLSLATIGISVINLAMTRACLLSLDHFRVFMTPWAIALAWAWWRFFLRYTPIVDPDAFVCAVDGRLKPGKARSLKDFGDLHVCTKCERGRMAAINLSKLVDGLGNNIRERIALSDGTYPSLPHPIAYGVHPDKK